MSSHVWKLNVTQLCNDILQGNLLVSILSYIKLLLNVNPKETLRLIEENKKLKNEVRIKQLQKTKVSFDLDGEQLDNFLRLSDMKRELGGTDESKYEIQVCSKTKTMKIRIKE